jgi:hypothetical protein
MISVLTHRGNMAKKKAKVRTTAQRRAAAKASWALRRLKSANAPTKNMSITMSDFPQSGVDFGREPSVAKAVSSITTPTSAVATREGDDLFVTITSNGSLFRHRLSYETMRKLGLDALHLVG